MSKIDYFVVRSSFFVKKDDKVEFHKNKEEFINSKREVLKFYRKFKTQKNFNGLPIVDKAIQITVLFKSLGE